MTDDPMAYDKFQNRSLEEQLRLIKGHEVVFLLFRRAEQYGVGIHIFTHFFKFSFLCPIFYSTSTYLFFPLF